MGRFTAKRGHKAQCSAAIVAGDRQLRNREYLFWNAKKIAKVLLGSAWLRVRAMLLERRAKGSRQDQNSGTEPRVVPSNKKREDLIRAFCDGILLPMPHPAASRKSRPAKNTAAGNHCGNESSREAFARRASGPKRPRHRPF
jgi:hypothetical protein